MDGFTGHAPPVRSAVTIVGHMFKTAEALAHQAGPGPYLVWASAWLKDGKGRLLVEHFARVGASHQVSNEARSTMKMTGRLIGTAGGRHTPRRPWRTAPSSPLVQEPALTAIYFIGTETRSRPTLVLELAVRVPSLRRPPYPITAVCMPGGERNARIMIYDWDEWRTLVEAIAGYALSPSRSVRGR